MLHVLIQKQADLTNLLGHLKQIESAKSEAAADPPPLGHSGGKACPEPKTCALFMGKENPSRSHKWNCLILILSPFKKVLKHKEWQQSPENRLNFNAVQKALQKAVKKLSQKL